MIPLRSGAPSVLVRLLGFLRPWPWALPALGALGLAGSLSEGIGIGLLIPFLGAATGQGGTSGPETFVTLFDHLSREERLAALGALIVGLVAARTAIVYANVALSNWLTGQASRDLRRAVFRETLVRGHPFIALRRPGELINVMDTQMWRTTDAFSYLFLMVASACTVAVFVSLLLAISWRLTLATLAVAIVASFAVRPLARRAVRLGQAAVRMNEGVLERVLEVLNGARSVVAFGREPQENDRFAAATEELRRAFLRLELTAGAVPPLLEFIYTPLLIGAVLLAVGSGVELPTLLAFLLLVYRLQPHVRNLEHSRVQLAGAAGAVDGVAALQSREAAAAAPPGLPFDGLERDIRLEGVAFRHKTDGERRPSTLTNVSFEIRRGETIALVGPSGAGKSTLLDLLLRFYEPDAGAILVDGTPLTDIDVSAWRRRVALAGQDAELFSGSVAANVAFGALEGVASQAEIEDAARRAGAHDFIIALPHGYETVVGVRGARLSGGQRQRIGLARALLRRPDLLLLDEATNALDGVSERVIQRTLSDLSGQVTIVIVAHRLSTVKHADHIVVLEGGRVVECSTPADLLSGRGAFARLFAQDDRDRSAISF